MAYPPLEIPETLAAGPGNTDPRVLERLYQTGVAGHMQNDVVRGMEEAKKKLLMFLKFCRQFCSIINGRFGIKPQSLPGTSNYMYLEAGFT